MRLRYSFALFLCGWMILSPIELRAEQDNYIKPSEVRIKELQSLRLQRQIQYQKRQAALQHVSRFMQRTATYRHFTLKEIKEL